MRTFHNLVGLSVAVSDANQDIWLGTTGYSNPIEGDTITSDMIFNIASVTKTFVAGITMQLIEEGNLSLGDSIYHWIPSHPYIDSTVTIKQMLNHTSGINAFINTDTTWFNLFLQYPDSLWDAWDAINSFLLPPAFPAGSTWGYSNTNYMLLGMIIEQETGLPLNEVIQNRVSIPYSLDRTFLEPVDFHVASNKLDSIVFLELITNDLRIVFRDWNKASPESNQHAW